MLELTPEITIDPIEMGQILRIYNLALKAAETWNEGIWSDRDRTHVLIDHIMYDILKITDGRVNSPHNQEA